MQYKHLAHVEENLNYGAAESRDVAYPYRTTYTGLLHTMSKYLCVLWSLGVHSDSTSVCG